MTRSKKSGYRWIILTVNFVFLAFAYASLTTWSVAILSYQNPSRSLQPGLNLARLY